MHNYFEAPESAEARAIMRPARLTWLEIRPQFEAGLRCSIDLRS
jgi:hypothetical protein